MSNVGKWDEFYKDVTEPDHYIDTATYLMGAEFLKKCETVEDWGCGKGWFAKTAQGSAFKVIGVDGSQTPFADKIEDLETYTTKVDGIFMRHVAEHNYNWDKVISNLCQSFTKNAVIIFYTPMDVNKEEATLLNKSAGWDDVPELSLPTKLIEDIYEKFGVKYTSKTIESAAAYKEETLHFLSK